MIIPLLKGLATTLKMAFSKPITLQYPEEKREVSPRWRGHPELTINDDGCPALCGLHPVHGGLPVQRHQGYRGRRG